MSMKDVVLKYPIWQEPYRAAVIETNPKRLENSADHHHELIALTDALTALKILAETTWADLI